MGAQWESYLAKAGPMRGLRLVAKGRADSSALATRPVVNRTNRNKYSHPPHR